MKRNLSDDSIPTACPACFQAVMGGVVARDCQYCGGHFCSRITCIDAHFLQDRNHDRCCGNSSAVCLCGERYCNALCGANIANCPACGVQNCPACAGPHATFNCGAHIGRLCRSVVCGCGIRYCIGCQANVQPCPGCHANICPACQALHAAVPGPGHVHYPCTHAACGGCGALTCGVCAALHTALGNDVHGTPCCPTNSAPCPRCTRVVANANLPVHLLRDAGKHDCCAGNATRCPTCTGIYCNAACWGPHTPACAVCASRTCEFAICPNCKQCRTCKPNRIRDICPGCLDLRVQRQAPFEVEHEFVPGSMAAVRRPLRATGTIKSTGTQDRGSPPPPLASGKTQVKDDIADLKQYDRGHIVALELDGLDNHYLIVPMIREFNQTGRWREMEKNIGILLGGGTLVDVRNGTVRPAVSASPVSLTLRSGNTIGTTWNIDVRMFYDDGPGESRIPVWFYTRVFYGKQLVTHFSLGNRCGKQITMPTREEVIEFQAAEDLYAKLWTEKKIVSDARFAGLFGEHVEKYTAPDSKVPPNQLLQFMHDLNDYAHVKKPGDKVFQTFLLVSILGSTPYQTFQRVIFKKFNRWKNRATDPTLLRSDVQENGLYPGEEADLYATLSECGGRNAPEIDHIDPSYQGGKNSYINGRMVSFYHNHVYREKKVTGSRPLNEALLERFKAGKLTLIRRDGYTICYNSADGSVEAVAPALPPRIRQPSVKLREPAESLKDLPPPVLPTPTRDLVFSIAVPGGARDLGEVTAFLDQHFKDGALFPVAIEMPSMTWPYQDKPVRDLIEQRKDFKKADQIRVAKVAIERDLERQYYDTNKSFFAGCESFIDDKDHPGRKEVLALIGETNIPLCRPSDILKNDGGMEGGVTADTFPVVANPRDEPGYQRVFAAAKALGLITD